MDALTTDDKNPPRDLAKCSKMIWTRSRIIKNVLVISLCFLLLFTAYCGIAILQSTLNKEQGMGVISQAVIYAMACLTAVVLPKIVIRTYGCKTSLAVSFLAYCPYIAYNFYPHWSTLLPASVILGSSAAVLWSAKSTYLNRLSRLYSELTVETTDSANSLIFGISSSIFETTHIWGNLISYYILQSPVVEDSRTSNVSSVCGVNFCENLSVNGNNSNLAEPDISQRYKLTTVFLVLGLLATLMVALAIDSLESEETISNATVKDQLKATFKVSRHTNQLLLMPLVLYTGMQQGFYAGDVTKAYIACSWGVYHVGFVSMCYGVSCALTCAACGRIVKYVGRLPVFSLATVTNIAAFTLLLTWTTSKDTHHVLFVIAALYGSFCGTFWSQLRSFYGVLFKEEEEAAFANNCLWMFLGYFISFSMSNYLCTRVKLYILICVLCFGVTGYAIVEYRIFCDQRNKKSVEKACNQ